MKFIDVKDIHFYKYFLNSIYLTSQEFSPENPLFMSPCDRFKPWMFHYIKRSNCPAGIAPNMSSSLNKESMNKFNELFFSMGNV